MNWRNLPGEITKRWQALKPGQKKITVVVGLGVLFTLIFLVALISRPAYAPLFTGLDPAEAGNMVEKLKEMNIPYRLTGQGKTIEVPEKQVYETRIQLASSGALGEDKGFELFDQTKLGITDFEQQVQYQRALQEELRRTITQLEEVEQARVHLVLPQKSVFIEEEKPSSASVVLKLKPLAQLKTDQIKGIVNLTAGSVEGLKPENIHLIDTKGNVLNADLALDEQAKLAQGTLKQYQVKRAYERELEKRICQMLERIFGPDKAVAMVTADLDFDRQEIESTTYQQGPKVSEQTIKEKGTAPQVGGTPGTTGNLPGYPAQVTQAGQQYSRDETIHNYQPTSRQEKIIPAAGRVRLLSVAVAVDTPVSPVVEQQVSEVVRAATGLNQTRGDQLSVSTFAFDKTYQQEIEKEMAQQEVEKRKEQQQRLLYAGVAAGLIILFIIIAVLVGALRRRAAQEAALEMEELKTIEEIEAAEREKREDIFAPQPIPLEEKIRNLARQKPVEVAEIIRVWLAES
jgi:flagellar M-ring protein FliF